LLISQKSCVISPLEFRSKLCCSYYDFLNRILLLTMKLLNQCSHLESFEIAIMTWFTVTENLYHRKPRTCSVYCSNNAVLFSSFMTHHLIFNKSNITDASSGTKTAYPSGTPAFIPSFSVVLVAQSLCFVNRYLSFCPYFYPL